MMLQIITGVILAALSAAPTVPMVGDAVVMNCEFERADDVNFDGWPDDWQRRLDSAHPAFAEIAINIDELNLGGMNNHGLRMSAAGESAVIHSREIEVDARFTYVLEGQVRMTGMKSSDVFASFTFVDHEGQTLATPRSQDLALTETWQAFNTRADAPDSATKVRIGLHVNSSDEKELNCFAMFDNLRVIRLPRLRIESSRPHNLFHQETIIEFACHLTGCGERDAIVLLELFDVAGQTIVTDELRIEANSRLNWRPIVTSAGFYRVRATLPSSGLRAVRSELTFAVLPDGPLTQPDRGSFGWTLAMANLEMPPSSLADLLHWSGVGWVKLPMSSVHGNDRTASHIEAIYRRGLKPVVVLEHSGSDWQSSLDQQLTNLPFSVQWVQLADRTDSNAQAVVRYLAQHASGIQLLTETTPPISIPSMRAVGLDEQAGELVRQMLDAKLANSQAAFFTNPFSEQRGLIGQKGQPTELFMPWYVTARMLSGGEWLGAIGLPGGSGNHVFRREGQLVMIVWSDTPRKETIRLGQKLRQLDVWGRESAVGSVGNSNVLELGPVPIFVTGLDEQIVRWHLGCRLQPDRLASVARQPQSMTLSVVNPLDKPVEVNVSLHAPQVWNTSKQFKLRLAPHGEGTAAFTVVPHTLIPSGRQIVHIEFEVRGPQTRQFVVYRAIEVRLDELSLDVSTNWDEDGTLIVSQQLLNNGDQPVSLNCLLFAPGQRRQRVQILDAEPGQHTTTYLVPNGTEFVGKTLWLEVHEIGGPRTLNRRIEIPQ